MVLTLSLCKLLRPVVVVFHVRDRASKVNLLTNLTFLYGVSSNVRRLYDHISRVLFAPEVLLDLDKVSLMFICSSVISLLNPALILEAFLISNSNLSFTVFFACQSCNRSFVWVAKAVIARFHEQDLIDGCTLLNRVGTDVGWVDHDFFDLAIGIQSRYTKKESAW